MSQPHTQSENPNKSRNGKSTSQQAVAEDRAAWEGMTEMPEQQTHSTLARRLLNRGRRLAERGASVLRRVMKGRS